MAKLKAVRDPKRIERDWEDNPRWNGITRDYTAEDVLRLRGSVDIEYTLAELGANRLWDLFQKEPYVSALGALTGNQAIQQVRAGLKAIYLSGWQVAADANLAGHMYPDQSLYPSNSVPQVVKRINQALQRADHRRRRSRFRRRAERVRADEDDDRGRRGRGPLRGPARIREKVRTPRREGPRPDLAVHPHPGLCSPGSGRHGRSHAGRGPHRCAFGDADHQRRR